MNKLRTYGSIGTSQGEKLERLILKAGSNEIDFEGKYTAIKT